MKKLFIGVIIGFLFSVALVNADLIVRGKRVVYTGDTITAKPTITESIEAPTNPQVNDLWRDITNNIVYIYNGRAGGGKRTTQSIKNDIQIFKDNIIAVDDIEARKCLNALSRMVFKLYKENG